MQWGKRPEPGKVVRGLVWSSWAGMVTESPHEAVGIKRKDFEDILRWRQTLHAALVFGFIDDRMNE